MPKLINYSGIRSGNLTLLSRAQSGGPGVGVIWNVRCDCGVIKKLVAKDVVRGRHKTCGNCEYSSRLRRAHALTQKAVNKKYKRVWKHYVRESMSRGQPWELEIDQLVNILSKVCSFCGMEPGHEGNILVSGPIKLDRMDPLKSYSLENCIPSCKDCKQIKGDLNYLTFIEHVLLIEKNIQKKLQA